MRKIFLTSVLLAAMATSAYAAYSLKYTVLSAVIVNATASQCGTFDISENMPSLDGDFAMQLSAISATGTADVKITVEPYIEATDAYVPWYDLSGVDHSTRIASSLSTFGGEGTWFVFDMSQPLIPFATKVRICATGVGTNPADTVVTLALIRK